MSFSCLDLGFLGPDRPGYVHEAQWMEELLVLKTWVP